MYHSPYHLECLHDDSHMDKTVRQSCIRLGWLLIEHLSLFLIRNWRNLDTAMITLVQYWFLLRLREAVDILPQLFCITYSILIALCESHRSLCSILTDYRCWCSNSYKPSYTLRGHCSRPLGLRPRRLFFFGSENALTRDLVAVDSSCRYDLLDKPTWLQNGDPSDISPYFRRQQDIQALYLGSHVLCLCLPLEQFLYPDIWLLAAF